MGVEMPHDPNEVDPHEQPTKPIPEVDPDATQAITPGSNQAAADAAPPTAATEPIAPYVPIADASDHDFVAPAAPPPAGPTRKSPVPWILGAAAAVLAIAIALAIWRPWENVDPAPAVTPAPSVSITPITPSETEAPTTEPSPPPAEEEAPEEETPEPTEEPEDTPEPTETSTETPTATQTTEPSLTP